ncbi:hypothetical protein F3Y22_tig00003715pilonHSYRG00232 [Hibiscus syriacus]|uniref:Uncharacterized protein n=1 Tax=Hibiscus syriacus TaxID=106335 RepID=A0A6A3CL93_HIBSY|nr:hypothetical protein F3Y22_tig00003715pilonHSYRG00232 [Hibiscus syriacus]
MSFQLYQDSYFQDLLDFKFDLFTNHDLVNIPDGSASSPGTSWRCLTRKNNGKKSEVMDLWSLLTQCAQSVAINVRRTANVLLEQISQHSSDTGDGTQRLAYYFANALKTRSAGLGAPSYLHLLSNKTSAADKRQSRSTSLISAFAMGSNGLALFDVSQQGLVDLPSFVLLEPSFPKQVFDLQKESKETGNRLKRFCERFNVPFEYIMIAKKWKTIWLEELKINKGEVVVVNCMYRLKNLPDDTMASTSARDTVLKLIRSINPELFIHGIESGMYNAPFFVTRFREALFHFSAKFNIFEANVSREDPGRMMFEKEVLGRDVMNVIACEGSERVERPETYKQWQARTVTAGFKQVPWDQELVKKVSNLVQCNYHRDFGLDLDGHRMLPGWKGRVIYALSCWKPGSNDP